MLEGASTVGGVWGEHRLYPGLKTNNMYGTYQFPDYDMDTATFGVKPGEFNNGAAVHNYLTSYAKHFGIYEKIRFNTFVENVKPTEKDEWLLETVTNPGGGNAKTIRARKLIVATGLTNEPQMPEIPGMEKFGAPLFHAKDFATRTDTIKSSKRMVVMGASKSAFDVANVYATSGVAVDMVIRASGRGPIVLLPSKVTPFKLWLEDLINTRALTLMSPCVWGDEDGYTKTRSFLHGTALGRGIVSTFWKLLQGDVDGFNGYDKHPEIAKIRPWVPAFWFASSIGVHNHTIANLDLIRDGRIRIHISDIDRLSPRTVHLSSGEILENVDTLVCATGWLQHPPISFPSLQSSSLGLPYHSPEPTPISQAADAELLRRFPMLKDQPEKAIQVNNYQSPNRQGPNQPFRLYRFVVPLEYLEKRNIAFAGMVSSASNPTCAHAQALWISAFFDGKLDREPRPYDPQASPSPKSMSQYDSTDPAWETALHTQYGRWRYPIGYGSRLPDFVFDSLPYVDMLLTDLGVDRYRKGGGFKELFTSYRPRQYEGIVGEWKEKHA